MVFGSLFGNPVRLSLVVDKGSYVPGEDLVYRVEVEAKKDVDLKELKAELVGVLRGRATCWYEEDDERYSRDVDFSLTLFRREQVLVSNVKLHKGRYVYSGRFNIPVDAAHSGKRGIVESEWFLRVEAKRTFRSSRSEAKINVINSGVNGAVIAKNLRFGNGAVVVRLPEYIRAGTRVRGVLQIGVVGERSPNEYCRELLIEVVNSVRIDRYTIDVHADNCDETMFTKTLVKKKLAENIALSSQLYELPFEFYLPGDVVPSFDVGRAYSKWLLTVTCSKGLLKKERSSIPLKVV